MPRDYSRAVDEKVAALMFARQHTPRNQFEATYSSMERFALKRAAVYFWSYEIAKTVLVSGQSLPGDTRVAVKYLLDEPAGWWYFERPIHLGECCAVPIEALLWSAHTMPDGKPVINVGLYCRRGSSALEVYDSMTLLDLKSIDEYEACEVRDRTNIRERLRSGESIPGLEGLQPGDESQIVPILRFFLACSLWLQQEIVTRGRGQLERHARKRVARLVGDDTNTELKIIALRRYASNDTSVESVGDEREYSCRWIVRGHWRQQYYPSTGEHKPKWILPHVKGPDDKPLRAPTAEVFAVVR